MEFTYWFAAFMIFYAYFGYPFCLFLLSFIFKRPQKSVSNKSNIHKVSFIITAYNEESRIKEKIINSLKQNYPKEKLEIIVASDCSSDKTDEIVRMYMDQGIKLVRAPERKGKENAQKHAVDYSSGDILVFSDVATILEEDGISSIVKNFDNAKIGCVSSEDKFINADGSISGEGLYVRYEMFLRKLESNVNTIVGLSGSFFAARRSVCQNWVVDLQSDFNTLLNSIKSDMKGFSDSKSIGYYKNIIDERREYDRKVRTILRGLSVFMRNLSLLNPIKYGLFSWQLFSHKLCRWMVPFFLIYLLGINFLLLDKTNYRILLMMQCFFYSAAFYHYLAIYHFGMNTAEGKKRISNKITKVPYFFVSVNISILFAWLKYVKGERSTFWNPSKR